MRIPFTKAESGLLSGGSPRGHKNLTKATVDLVKGGWRTKGLGGWEMAANVLHATVAFETTGKLADALNNGTQIPAGAQLPESPAEGPETKESAARTAARKPSTKAPTIKASAESEAEISGVVRGDQAHRWHGWRFRRSAR